MITNGTHRERNPQDSLLKTESMEDGMLQPSTAGNPRPKELFKYIAYLPSPGEICEYPNKLTDAAYAG